MSEEIIEYPLITCPYCGEPDFDLVGLKWHLLVDKCLAFENTEDISR